MELDVSSQMRAKMAAVGDEPILDSEFVPLVKYPPEVKAERTWGTKGQYISSPADGWKLRGPFGGGE